MNSIPNEVNNVIVLKGIEANILDFNGNIDYDGEMFQNLDFVMAGFHYPLIESTDIYKNTQAMLNVIKNPIVSIISHPDNPKYPVDFDEVARAAYENNVALEFNSGSVLARPGSDIKCIDMLKSVEKFVGYISLGSDAHFCSRVGDLDYCESIIRKMNFNKEMVLNNSVNKVVNFFKYKKIKN
ncbi:MULTISPECIES: hydrolase [unclassified Gilliamella]|uniref:hydrolase n=1 Tax=unclassified Gilliamella TaxID=2685620 RepID=UPI0013209C7C|nr:MULTISPECIES: hydrolase [unclassified Gilliamella]MWN32775.1 hydrolase [Gilliamella sp. Pra-s60]MWP30191.1 hydrolase [Gilliamella sp. Pra-s54]